MQKIKIQFEPPSFKDQIIKEIRYSEIILDSKGLTFAQAFDCDEFDSNTGTWHYDVFKFYDHFFLRSAITGVVKANMPIDDGEPEYWQINVWLSGVSATINFKSIEEMDKAFKLIKQWLRYWDGSSEQTKG